MALSEAVAARAARGDRLDAADVGVLTTGHDLLALGALADDARRQRHGARTTFVRVHEVDVQTRASWDRAVPDAAREVRIMGLPPTLDDALECVRVAAALASGRVVRGFSLADLKTAGIATSAAGALAAAGLAELAFVEAETEADAVRAWRDAGVGVRVVGVAHAVADPVAWLFAVRALHDEVGGIEAVAPLPRQLDPTTPTTGYQDVRLVAVARLALESIPHVQVDWRRYGPKLAQVALTVGADDLDGVSAVDDLTLGPRRSPLEDVRRNVAAAGGAAAERDGAFRVIA